MCPFVDDLTAALVIGDHTILVTLLNQIDLALCFLQFIELLFRGSQVSKAERESGAGGRLESQILHVIKELESGATPTDAETVCNDRLQIRLGKCEVVERHVFVIEKIIEDDATRRRPVEAMLVR